MIDGALRPRDLACDKSHSISISITLACGGVEVQARDYYDLGLGLVSIRNFFLSAV